MGINGHAVKLNFVMDIGAGGPPASACGCNPVALPQTFPLRNEHLVKMGEDGDESKPMGENNSSAVAFAPVNRCDHAVLRSQNRRIFFCSDVDASVEFHRPAESTRMDSER